MTGDIDKFRQEQLARRLSDKAERRRGNLTWLAGHAGSLVLAGIGVLLGSYPLIWSAVAIGFGWAFWDQRRDRKLRRARELERAEDS